MKKVIFILMLILTLSLSACGSDDTCEHSWKQTGTTDDSIVYTCDKCGEEKKEDIVKEAGLTKEEWQNAAKAENFVNYTLEFTAKSPTDSSTDQYSKYKITANLVSITAKYGNEVVVDNLPFNEEESADQRNLYSAIFTQFLAVYENFVYDEENDYYTNTIDIVCNATMNYQGVTVDATFKNCIVKFNSDKLLSSIECTFVQATHVPDGSVVSIETHTTFILSDYGTTVVE